MTNQRLRNHPLYAEYAKMRIRERELLCEEVELRKEGVHGADFLKANRKFALARKKLDGVEKVLSVGLNGQNLHLIRTVNSKK